MQKLRKNGCCILLILSLLFTLSINLHAATVYNVVVNDKTVAFQSGGKTVGTYTSRDGAVTLSDNTRGDLLVCFYNASNKYTRVNVGNLSAFEISGTFSKLTLDKSLSNNRRITVGASSSISEMKINSQNQVTLRGKVGTLTVSSAAAVALVSGASVDSATVSASGAELTAASGSTVNKVKAASGATVSGPGIKSTEAIGSSSASNGKYSLQPVTLTARSGDTLEDLLSDLNESVKATSANGTRISGYAEWDDSDSTAVRKSGSYDYTFYPNNSSYDSLEATAKITLSGSSSGTHDDSDDSDLNLEFENLRLSSSRATLKDLVEDLNDAVHAYNSDDERVRGECEWVSGSGTQVSSGRSYEFRFIPDDDFYDTVKDTIKITLGSSSSSSSTVTSGGLTMKIEPIDASYNDKLSELEGDLPSHVRVYDKYDEEVKGSFSWTASGSTKVTKSSTYEFRFSPKSAKYDPIRGQIKIYVDGDNTASNGDITLKITSIDAAYDDRLSSLLDALSDSVRAYDKNDDRVSGAVEWVSAGSTRITKTGTYSFLFIPDSTRYDEVEGQIKIYINGENNSSVSSKLTLAVFSVEASSGDRLSSLTNQLRDSVRAYNDQGSRVDGKVSWVPSDSTRVTKTESFRFQFKPDSSRYDTTRGEITVYIGGSGSTSSGSSNSSHGSGSSSLTLEVDTIQIRYPNRLSSLTSDLNDAVTAKDRDGYTISGKASWSEKLTTKVNSTGKYKFVFKPDDSNYDNVEGTITIEVG